MKNFFYKRALKLRPLGELLARCDFCVPKFIYSFNILDYAM